MFTSWQSQTLICCVCSGYSCFLWGEDLHVLVHLIGLSLKLFLFFQLANKAIFLLSVMEMTLNKHLLEHIVRRANWFEKRSKVITLSVLEFMLKQSKVQPHKHYTYVYTDCITLCWTTSTFCVDESCHFYIVHQMWMTALLKLLIQLCIKASGTNINNQKLLNWILIKLILCNVSNTSL